MIFESIYHKADREGGAQYRTYLGKYVILSRKEWRRLHHRIYYVLPAEFGKKGNGLCYVHRRKEGSRLGRIGAE